VPAQALQQQQLRWSRRTQALTGVLAAVAAEPAQQAAR
jgi:hypothetical protein